MIRKDVLYGGFAVICLSLGSPQSPPTRLDELSVLPSRHVSSKSKQRGYFLSRVLVMVSRVFSQQRYFLRRGGRIEVVSDAGGGHTELEVPYRAPTTS